MHAMPNVLLSQRFSCFEELSAAVVAWDLDFRQISRNYSDTTLDQIQAGEILFTHLSCGFFATHGGATPEGMFTFAAPDFGCPVFRYSDQLVDQPALLVGRPGSEFDLLARPGHGISTFSIPDSTVQEHCEAVLGCSFDTLVRPDTRVLFIDRRLAGNWREMAFALLANKQNSFHASLRDALPKPLESRLLDCMLDSLCSAEQARKGPGPVARGRIFRRALEYVSAHRQEALTVRELASAVNTTERTLERAFNQEFGVSPKRYLLGQRLYGVHKTLWHAHHAETSVADIANDWGFWHQGQFARDYRCMFGELPSETLNESPDWPVK